jgi:nucleoside-diphosphate-sugar epimerase
MKVLLTGAVGYLGLAVGRALRLAGHEVVGVVRNEVDRKTAMAAGMAPLLGDLTDVSRWSRAFADADAVVEMASADDHDAAVQIADSLAGSGKRYLRTGGVGIYSELTLGEPGATVYDEDTAFTPHEYYLQRLRTDERVVAAARNGVHSVVLRPGMVYGAGGSEHLPVLLQAALRDGRSRYVGAGRNQYSTVYLDDLAAGYVLALEKAPAGSVYNLSSGETTFGEIAGGISEILQLSPPASVPLETAVEVLGPLYGMGVAVAARADSTRAREELGWTPLGPTLLEDLTGGSYRRLWGRRVPTVVAS